MFASIFPARNGKCVTPALCPVNRPIGAHFDVSGKSALSDADLALSSPGRRCACVIRSFTCRSEHQHTMDSSYSEAVENPTWRHTGLNVPALAILHFSRDWNISV